MSNPSLHSGGAWHDCRDVSHAWQKFGAMTWVLRNGESGASVTPRLPEWWNSAGTDCPGIGGSVGGDGHLTCAGLSDARWAMVADGPDADSRTGSTFLGCLLLSLGTTDSVPVSKGSMGLSVVTATDGCREV